MLWHLLGECVKVTVLLVCSICIVHKFLFIYFFFFFFAVIDLCFFLYIKRVNRLMNSVMNSIFGLMTCLPPPPPPLFLQVHHLRLNIFFFLRIFICLLYTCNVSLHYIHKKSSKYYIQLTSSWTMLWIIFLA